MQQEPAYFSTVLTVLHKYLKDTNLAGAALIHIICLVLRNAVFARRRRICTTCSGKIMNRVTLK